MAKWQNSAIVECQEIINDKNEVLSECGSRPSVQELPGWLEKKADLVLNERFHPVSRVAIIDGFESVVDDAIRKLQQAASGSNNAWKEYVRIKQKIPVLLQDGADWIREELQKLQYVLSKTKVWQNVKKQAIEDQKIATQRLKEITPKDKESWRSYYGARLRLLESDEIDCSAKLIWTNESKRLEFIQKYIKLLDELIAGQHKENEFEQLQKEIKIVLLNETRRVQEVCAKLFGSA